MRPSICLVLFVCSGFAVFPQGVRTEKQPDWVTTVTYSENTADPSTIGGGYYYLLVDRQHQVEKQEVFRHFAIKVLSEKGLQSASSIEETYDPAYQVLIFHFIVIKRQGKMIDKLEPRKIQVLRREENLERQEYDGALSAVVNLEGVQPGDIVEYAYTIRGRNPVFNGKFFTTFYLSYNDPTGKIYCAVTASPSRPLQVNYLHTNATFRSHQTGMLMTRSLELENIPAVMSEDNTPDWYEQYSRAEFSEFKSWQELQGWVKGLFGHEKKQGRELDDKIREIRNAGPAEIQVRKSIEFVQDEIRYLSFSGGINDYKPHPPGQVFTQRFGDCKDKSLLLSYVLGELGIESHPALVSTGYGKTLNERLPTPWAFDHCIVTMRFRDSVYWIDPTLSFQRGRLALRTVPTYYQALVAADRPAGLEAIPFGLKQSSIQIEENYTVAKVGTTATLEVNTVYEGDEADNVRHQRQASSLDEIGKSYLNFYATDFPTITATAPVVFTDDLESNRMTTHEVYAIDSFWKFDSVTHKYSVETYARTLSNYLKIPDTKIRNNPYTVVHPVYINQVIKIHLPEPWTVEDEVQTIQTPSFFFHSSTWYHDNSVRLGYTYQTKKDFVPAAEIKEHLAKINQARSGLTFQLTYATETARSNALPWQILVGVIIVVTMLVIRKRRAS
jgi:hypothetical protein